MNTLQICPPHLSYAATFPWEFQKSHFSTLLFMYFRLFTLPQKKTNNNCCTAALAVCLLLFNASYYLHGPSTAPGARYGRSACIDMDMLRLAAAVCCDMGWILAQRGVLCNWSSHARTVVRECCKGDDESQWERVKFDPPPPKNPLTDGHQNLRT